MTGKETYRVLAAALGFEQFTVAELARLTGVKEATVRSAISRDGRFEVVGEEPSSRPGGRHHIHRIKPDERHNVRLELSKLYSELAAIPGSESDDPDEPPITGVPPGLRMAQSLLLHKLPLSRNTHERSRTLELARHALISGARETEEAQIGDEDLARLRAQAFALHLVHDLAQTSEQVASLPIVLRRKRLDQLYRAVHLLTWSNLARPAVELLKQSEALCGPEERPVAACRPLGTDSLLPKPRRLTIGLVRVGGFGSGVVEEIKKLVSGKPFDVLEIRPLVAPERWPRANAYFLVLNASELDDEAHRFVRLATTLYRSRLYIFDESFHDEVRGQVFKVTRDFNNYIGKASGIGSTPGFGLVMEHRLRMDESDADLTTQDRAHGFLPTPALEI